MALDLRAPCAAAHLDWVPQETILIETSRLDRPTTSDLAPDATCLFCESVALGGHAMGEDRSAACLTDSRLIRRNGRAGSGRARDLLRVVSPVNTVAEHPDLLMVCQHRDRSIRESILHDMAG